MSRNPEVAAGVADLDLSGTTALVTGSTGGIGRETALSLGRLGATVVVHGRDERKGREVVGDLRAVGAPDPTFVSADFADLDAVERLARAVADRADELDVLVNNAGGLFPDHGTVDGVEYTFAVNHLAPFLLTARLLDRVRAAGGRIVTVSSDAHRGASMDFDALRRPAGPTGFGAYARSKLANVLFTRELARRLDEADAPVAANCLHPGAIPGSGFARNTPFPFRLLTDAVAALPDPLKRPFVTTVRDGAATPVYLAASPEVAGVSGEYFADCERRAPSKAARDDRVARRLWAESERLTGIETPV